MFQAITTEKAVNKFLPDPFLLPASETFAPKVLKAAMEHPWSHSRPVTMGSREIAELTGKSVGSVHRDIRSMLYSLAIDDDTILDHVSEIQDARGYTTDFWLRRREVEILLAGYSVSLRAKVIDRWHELEDQQFKPPFTVTSTLHGAACLMEELEAQRSALASEVKAQTELAQLNREKAACYDTIIECKDLISMETAAAVMGSGRSRLCKYMRTHGIFMSATRRLNMPYQKHRDAGRFVVKMGAYKNRVTGEVQIKAVPFLTVKGLIWLERFIKQHGRIGL